MGQRKVIVTIQYQMIQDSLSLPLGYGTSQHLTLSLFTNVGLSRDYINNGTVQDPAWFSAQISIFLTHLKSCFIQVYFIGQFLKYSEISQSAKIHAKGHVLTCDKYGRCN